MKKIFILLTVIVTLSLLNCMGLNGSLYTNVVDNATIINKDASAKEGIGAKMGESCATAYLGLVATGDAGIKAAARAGGINNVRGMDFRVSSILGSLYVSKCTIVHGD